MLGHSSSAWLDIMIRDIIEVALKNDGAVIRFSPELDRGVIELRDWLFRHVYRTSTVSADFEKAMHILRELFRYFVDRQDELEHYSGWRLDGQRPEIVVADFVAGMTDRFAINLYNKIFLPRPWSVV